MNKQDIQILHQYNSWANKRILDAAENITTDQFLATASYPHGGLRGTLTHTLFAEWIWRRRWQGESPTVRIQPEEFPTLAALRARWLDEEKLLLSFVDSLTDEKLNSPFSYKTTKGESFKRTLWHAMAHVFNHGTQHRSEAAAMLTELGHSPGDVDFILFIHERNQ
jgi:uncharacterized damage-inducible protein DinB